MNRARGSIGDESFGAARGLNRDVAPAVAARFFWYDEDDHSDIAARIPRFPGAAHAPCSPDAKGYISDVAPCQIAKRHDGNITAGLCAYILDDLLNARPVFDRYDVREITDKPDRCRHLELTDLDLQHGQQRGECERKARHEIVVRCAEIASYPWREMESSRPS